MATLPAFFRRHEAPAAPVQSPETLRAARPRAERDPYSLRPLPHEDILLFCKRIDNSRLVREPDLQARGACWSAIGLASMVLLIVTSASAPYVAATMSGYKVERLRAEERHLLEELRNQDLEEARLLSQERLNTVARERKLGPPAPGQVVRLDGKASAVAMVK